MAMNMKPVFAFLMALVWALGIVVVLGMYAGTDERGIQRDCASLAWRVANRNHSILDSTAFQHTERQAYATCINDPEGFGRLVRRGL
jgi:hypothetical protein